jgi:hypothetical protein
MGEFSFKCLCASFNFVATLQKENSHLIQFKKHVQIVYTTIKPSTYISYGRVIFIYNMHEKVPSNQRHIDTKMITTYVKAS